MISLSVPYKYKACSSMNINEDHVGAGLILRRPERLHSASSVRHYAAGLMSQDNKAAKAAASLLGTLYYVYQGVGVGHGASYDRMEQGRDLLRMQQRTKILGSLGKSF